MTFVLGMLGPARSGKTTAAQFLVEEHESNEVSATLLSMAGPLKEGLAVMGIRKSTHPDLYRMAAQYIGTNIVRDYDPNWWCNLFTKEVKYLETLYDVITVDDVRFPNEAETIRNNNGILLYIHSGDRLDLEAPLYRHDSESLALGIHQFVSTLNVDWSTVNYISVMTKAWGKVYIVNNTRSLEDFENALKVLYANIKYSDNTVGIHSIEVEGDNEGLAG